MAVFTVANLAHTVGRNQGAFLTAANIAHTVGDQFSIIPTLNIAGIVEGSQWGLVNIAYQKAHKKQVGIINYARDLAEGAKQYGLINIQGPREGKSWLFTEIYLGLGQRKSNGKDENLEDIVEE